MAGPLCYAAARDGQLEEVERLLQLKPRAVRYTDEYGHCPLLEAAYHGHADVVQVLLRCGADIEQRDLEGWCPLYRAAMAGHAHVVRVLLDCGADANVRAGGGGWSPVIAAAAYGQDDALLELLTHRNGVQKDVDQEDLDARTALWWAASGGCTVAVKLLLEAGADWGVRDNHGRLPVDMARHWVHPHCTELLEEAERSYLVYRAKTLIRLCASPCTTTPPCLKLRRAHGRVLPSLSIHHAPADISTSVIGTSVRVAQTGGAASTRTDEACGKDSILDDVRPADGRPVGGCAGDGSCCTDMRRAVVAYVCVCMPWELFVEFMVGVGVTSAQSLEEEHPDHLVADGHWRCENE